VDDQLVFGDVDGDGLVLVGPTEGDLLPDDHDDAAVRRPPLHPNWFDRWLRRGAGWPGGA
jgi:hypothetical protein